jgi:hypothetical protein
MAGPVRPNGEKVVLGAQGCGAGEAVVAGNDPERNRTDVHQPESLTPSFFAGRDVGVEGLHGGAGGGVGGDRGRPVNLPARRPG